MICANFRWLRAAVRVRRDHITAWRSYSHSGAGRPAGSVVLEEMVTTRARHGSEPAVSLTQAVANLHAAYPPLAKPPAPVSSKAAAVLVPLFESRGEVHVVLTQRSSKLRAHPGEVCFPGGKREPGDADDEATALREAHEELGLHPSVVSVVATLPPVLSKHFLSVTPVVGTVPAGLRFTPNPDEVEMVFTAPLAMFLAAGPAHSHRDVRWEGLPYRLHSFEHTHGGRTQTIWGLTAGMLVIIAEKALGRAPEFDLSPPGAMPYSALAYDNGRLVFRSVPAGGSSLAGTAAVQGALVTDEEAAAAVGEEAELEGEDDSAHAL